MRADKDGGRGSATPNERPSVPHQGEARGASPSIYVPRVPEDLFFGL